MSVKKVVKKIKEAFLPPKGTGREPKLEVLKTNSKEVVCSNCNRSGKDCSVCTPVFVDTFK